MHYIISNPKYVRAIIFAAVLIAAVVAVLAIADPTFAGHCPTPDIPVCS